MSKPVAYEESLEEMLDFLLHQGFGNKYIEGFEDGADWHKCTHPVKQLSDEEIDKFLAYAQMQGYGSNYLDGLDDGIQWYRSQITKEITE